MGPNEQIFWGSMFLGGCIVLHVLLLGFAAIWLENAARITRKWRLEAWHNIVIILTAVLILVLSHTIHIWLWAFYFLYHRVIETWNTAIYFSLITYTTVGYGDIVLGPDFRIFAAFNAVTGLFAFGLSTAFIVAVMSNLFRTTHPTILGGDAKKPPLGDG
jgi:hypothetical protein